MILPEIEEPVDRLPLLQHLLKIWEHSVQATHDFLQEQDIIALRPVVEQALPQYAVAKWQCRQVDVNEQNGSAAGFYQHLGFVVKSRSSLDEQGNPFPILHLEL